MKKLRDTLKWREYKSSPTEYLLQIANFAFKARVQISGIDTKFASLYGNSKYNLSNKIVFFRMLA